MRPIFALFAGLVLLLASCTPSRAPSLTAPTSPPATPTPTAEATTTPPQPAATRDPITAEVVDLPRWSPSLRIGKGSATSLAVSPDGKWLAVGTQFGLHQYRADTFEQVWFLPLTARAGQAVFDPHSTRLGVSAGSEILLLDPATGERLTPTPIGAGKFAWSPDGKRLVTGGGCQTVAVWDATHGSRLQELRGGLCSEGNSGVAVAWAADGRIYASFGAKLFAWDGGTYAPDDEFSTTGVKGTWISALAAAPAGGLLAQFDAMGLPVIAIIDGQQDRLYHLLDGQDNGRIVALAWAPDGRRLAVSYGLYGQESAIPLTLIWNAQTGQVEQEIYQASLGAGLGWSADGRTLFGLEAPDGTISAIEVASGRVLRTLGDHAPAGSFLTWTGDGLISTNGLTLTRWDPISGEALDQQIIGSRTDWMVSWPPSGPDVLLYANPDHQHQVGPPGSRQPLAGIDAYHPLLGAWSWDGSRLAGPTQVWDARTGELLASLHDPAQQHTPDKIAWSPDGRLASADSLNIQPPVVWDAATGEVLFSLAVAAGGLDPLWLGLAWSPDGERFAAVGSLMHTDGGMGDGMILIWDAHTGQQEQRLTAGMHGYRLTTAAWSPDSRLLACGTTGKDLFVWDVANGKPLARLAGHTDISDSLAWSPEGDRLASVARDGTLLIWDIPKNPATGSTTASWLEWFPLHQGTQWTYSYTSYSAAPGDHELLLQGELEVTETVSEVQANPSATLVHVQGNRSLVSADPGWEAVQSLPVGAYESYYLLQGGAVYRSERLPQPEELQSGTLPLEFQFPLSVGASWCPSQNQKDFLTPLAATPAPCEYTGARTVVADGPFETAAGRFERCYQMADAVNSGGVVQWFCEDVGVVARQYDHAGSRFGFAQELIAFTPGSPLQ